MLAGQAEDPEHFDVPRERIDGARHALAAVGGELDERWIAPGEFTVECGYRAARTLLEPAERPTALFALSDEMAFGAVLAARDLGLDVPGDVSLVGVDDHETAAVYGLTTVRQHVVEQGAIAARLVLRTLASAPGGSREDVTVPAIELVVRRSTGPVS